jgi:hypothetical protein
LQAKYPAEIKSFSVEGRKVVVKWDRQPCAVHFVLTASKIIKIVGSGKFFLTRKILVHISSSQNTIFLFQAVVFNSINITVKHNILADFETKASCTGKRI